MYRDRKHAFWGVGYIAFLFLVLFASLPDHADSRDLNICFDGIMWGPCLYGNVKLYAHEPNCSYIDDRHVNCEGIAAETLFANETRKILPGKPILPCTYDSQGLAKVGPFYAYNIYDGAYSLSSVPLFANTTGPNVPSRCLQAVSNPLTRIVDKSNGTIMVVSRPASCDAPAKMSLAGFIIHPPVREPSILIKTLKLFPLIEIQTNSSFSLFSLLFHSISPLQSYRVLVCQRSLYSDIKSMVIYVSPNKSLCVDYQNGTLAVTHDPSRVTDLTSVSNHTDIYTLLNSTGLLHYHPLGRSVAPLSCLSSGSYACLDKQDPSPDCVLPYPSRKGLRKTTVSIKASPLFNITIKQTNATVVHVFEKILVPPPTTPPPTTSPPPNRNQVRAKYCSTGSAFKHCCRDNWGRSCMPSCSGWVPSNIAACVCMSTNQPCPNHRGFA